MFLPARGRKRRDIPDYYETRTVDNKIRCTLCQQEEFDVSRRGEGWINPSSIRGHEKSAHHQSRLQQHETLTNQSISHEIEDESFVIANNIPFDDSSLTSVSNNPNNPSCVEQEMWDNFVCTDDAFGIDKSREEIEEEERRKFEQKASRFGLWGGPEIMPFVENIEDMEGLQDEVEHDEVISTILKELDVEAFEISETEKPAVDPSRPTSEMSPWYPYPSKLLFLLDTIDNLPRLRISGSLMKVVLWLLKGVGIQNVPSFDGLRKVQQKVRNESGIPTINWMSPKGNAFSFNDPRSLIANDWMNPRLATKIRRYPVIPRDGVVSEIWHARKWRNDLDRHILSPMYDAGHEIHYFIDEPATLSNGNFVIPLRWLEDEDGAVWADAWKVEYDPVTKLSTICDDKTITINALDLQKCMLDIEADGEMPKWSPETVAKGHTSRMPNPDRVLAEGDPLYTSFIDVFGDDVSGNRSKSWNKHWNIYITHRNLPRKLLNQQNNIHFVSTSTYASCPEQFQGIKDIIEETHRKPVKVRDASNGQQIRFKIYCNCAPGDNPSQSETSGHIGGQGNHPCRKCKLGGAQKIRETNEGFHASFSGANPRSSHETLQMIERQVQVACFGIAQDVKDLQTNSGVKDMYTQYWIDELILASRKMRALNPSRSTQDIHAELMEWVNNNKTRVYNPFLTMPGFDACQDTPVEILHTILLGVVKYTWHGTHSSWSAAQQKIYSNRLQATETSGLSIHPIRASYITQYANSLIGRQLKTLVQVNVFHIYDLVDTRVFQLAKAIGELSALLWFTEIRKLDEYLADVRIAAANVLDTAALLDPSKILSKIKYHLLAHLVDDIIRFGPLVGVATEVFEGFNAIFRHCSILSNHLAPSRDIAHQLAEQETLKHLLSGGWWETKDGKWTTSGPSVRHFITSDPILKALIGWDTTDNVPLSGSVKLSALKRGEDKKIMARVAYRWCDTSGNEALNINDIRKKDDALWFTGMSVVSKSKDCCKVGSWVYTSSPFSSSSPPITGRILQILQNTTDDNVAWVVLDVFDVAATRHEKFGTPVLKRRLDEKRVLAVRTKDILFEYNAQHDCHLAGCSATGTRPVVQERIQSNVTEAYIEHKPLDVFLINTHAFHNAHLIRAVLPRELVAPVPYSADRSVLHNDIAEKLRETQNSKRAAVAAKAAERRKTTAAVGSGDGSATLADSGVDTGAGSGRQKRRRVESSTVNGGPSSMISGETIQAPGDMES